MKISIIYFFFLYSLRSENVGIQEKLTIAKDTMEANREKSLTAKKKCDELHKAIKGYEEKIQCKCLP